MGDRLREQRYAEAAAFLGEVLERVESGNATFEACCAERPHLTQELQELYAACHRLSSVDAPRAPSGEQEFSSALLARLSGRKGGFERYQLRGEIAKGGQGTVIQVWDDDLRRHLAMKVLVGRSGESSGTGSRAVSARSLSRFLEEAQVTGQLDHPGIVPIHELGLDDQGRVYFTMKLVKGRTLKEVFQLVAEGQEGWTLTRALSVLLKVCEAMAYAHHKGVVHRDLKPANVMVGRFGEVYVMDWGLARMLGREDRTDVSIAPEASTAELHSERDSESGHASQVVTKDGHVVGTPAYMSPEQAKGLLEEIGPHSDVYSVGAMLYHLLAGHMPYVKPGTSPTNYSIWYIVQDRPPDPLHERAPDAPAELVAICEKAMARDIGARYRDMGALEEDLMAFLEHRAVKAYQTGAAVELRKWIERNKGLAAASAAAVLVLIVGLVTALVLKNQSDDNAALAKHNAELASKNAADSARNAEEAHRQADEAQREKERAEKNEQDLLRLSALQDLDDLEREADRLWPVRPELILRYEEWLMQAQTLIDEIPAHEARLAELRARASVATLAAGVAASAQGAWEFASRDDRWWHAQLVKLVDGLYAFSKGDTGLVSGTSPERGWGVKKRLEFARTVEERTLRGPEASARWAEAIASIGDPEQCPDYGGLALAPQLGLVPIGQDRDSGLWEFAHLQSGEPPLRGPDGKLILTERTGIVLVLLPGGKFWMGAQSTNPRGQNYDPQAHPDELPVQKVTLDPFFLSKYEMTQAQWERCTGKNPSMYGTSVAPAGSDPVSPVHPVEQVSWRDCQQALFHLGLELPTEAEWEYGARGGTSTIWWTGDEPRYLQGADNLADSFFKRNSGATVSSWPCEEWLDDGHMVHAPVGTYAPNPFGLHEVHGNVSEWCREIYLGYDVRVRAGDGERGTDVLPAAENDDPAERTIRGGDYWNLASFARAAARYHATPGARQNGYGVRPARSLSR